MAGDSLCSMNHINENRGFYFDDLLLKWSLVSHSQHHSRGLQDSSLLPPWVPGAAASLSLFPLQRPLEPIYEDASNSHIVSQWLIPFRIYKKSQILSLQWQIQPHASFNSLDIHLWILEFLFFHQETNVGILY